MSKYKNLRLFLLLFLLLLVLLTIIIKLSASSYLLACLIFLCWFYPVLESLLWSNKYKSRRRLLAFVDTLSLEIVIILITQPTFIYTKITSINVLSFYGHIIIHWVYWSNVVWTGRKHNSCYWNKKLLVCFLVAHSSGCDVIERKKWIIIFFL